MSASIRVAVMSVGMSVATLFGLACVPGPAPTPLTTMVGRSTGTFVKTSGLVDVSNTCTPATPPAPDVAGFWNAQPPTNRLFAIAGFEIWRNTTDGCTTTRLDTYRAVTTFNMASVSNLKGLVTHAELVVSPRALPAGVGAHPACIAFTGGAGTLQRFGPATAGNVPQFSSAGSLIQLPPPSSFPVATNTVFTFPMPWSSGTLAGASNPTSTLASGTGGATFTVDITGSVNAALNGGSAAMSWMVTSAFEGPLAAPLATSLDCKTPYDLRLNITHY